MHELLREYVQGFQLPGLKDHFLEKLDTWTETGLRSQSSHMADQCLKGYGHDVNLSM